MSAGAMVAGGLAFTIPGIWILDSSTDVDWWQMLIVALAGCVFGLICCAVLRRHFIERAHLEFPIGEAAAETLIAGNSGGKTGAKLFGSMGIAGIYTFLRDGLGALPSMFFGNVSVPGVAFGIYNSPMMLAVGFLVGTAAVVVWFIGALFGNFGIIVGGTAAGLWDAGTAQGICSSLGMGTMMGCGVGVIAKMLFKAIRARGASGHHTSAGSQGCHPASAEGAAQDLTDYDDGDSAQPLRGSQNDGWPLDGSQNDGITLGGSRNGGAERTRHGSYGTRHEHGKQYVALVIIAVVAVALLICFALQLGPIASMIVVVAVWITSAMAAQSCGQTGIDPMEIFGLIVLLIAAATSGLPHAQLFFIAAIIAVACGLAGDVMNDFKAGHMLGTNPRAQWIGEAIGSIVGAIVAVAVMCVLVGAYGAGAFGPHGTFIAAQASVVATMVGGIPSLPAFIIGLVAGFVLYLTGLPVMMLGLGIYLPFYMSFTAFLGAMVKVVYDAICKQTRKRQAGAGGGNDELKKRQGENGLVISSGLLGGESVVGVILALAAVITGIGG
jgi:uncharacterized oligopeptide transporter (OPT) family protein